MTLLHIDASILNEQSASRQLTASIVDHLISIKPALKVIRYDLVNEPVGHLSNAEFLAFHGAEPHTDEAKLSVYKNMKILNDFLVADTLVIGAPMYNFSLPTQLRAWLDRLSVPGKTFRYSANGVEGLAGGKRVIIASTRGGLYGEGTPLAFLEHHETYLRGFFGFLGITDIHFVRAEGLAISPESRETSMKAALADIQKLGA